MLHENRYIFQKNTRLDVSRNRCSEIIGGNPPGHRWGGPNPRCKICVCARQTEREDGGGGVGPQPWQLSIENSSFHMQRQESARRRRRSLKLAPEKKGGPPPPPNPSRRSRIKSGICYNLNNCAADEFKILQSYLLVGHKALLIIILGDFRFRGDAPLGDSPRRRPSQRSRARRRTGGTTELRSPPNLQDAHAPRLIPPPGALAPPPPPDNGTVRVVFNLRVGGGGRRRLKYRLQFCMQKLAETSAAALALDALHS